MEEGRLGSHRSVLLNGLGATGFLDEAEAEAGAGAGADVDADAAGIVVAVVADLAVRLMAAIAAAADGADWPMETLGSLSVSLDDD